MKKLTAILLLTVFVFNTIGYKWVFDYFQAKADQHLDARLDAGKYADDELITIKVPINLPYQNNWNSYERVDGEVNINGEVYKYVKRTVLNDTMIFKCIPHIEKSRLIANANDYFGKTNDLPGNNARKAEVLKQLFGDFDFTTNHFANTSLDNTTSFKGGFTCYIPQRSLAVDKQPPRSC